MRIYIAGSSTEMERVAEFMSACRALGYLVTLDWVEIVLRNGGVANPKDVAINAAREWSERDLAAIAEADVFVMLAPLDGAPARGAFVELGFAVARAKATLVVRSPSCHSIFQSMAEHQASTDFEALAILRRMIRRLTPPSTPIPAAEGA